MLNPLSIPYANRSISRARSAGAAKGCPGYVSETDDIEAKKTVTVIEAE